VKATAARRDAEQQGHRHCHRSDVARLRGIGDRRESRRVLRPGGCVAGEGAARLLIVGAGVIGL